MGTFGVIRQPLVTTAVALRTKWLSRLRVSNRCANESDAIARPVLGAWTMRLNSAQCVAVVRRGQNTAAGQSRRRLFLELWE